MHGTPPLLTMMVDGECLSQISFLHDCQVRAVKTRHVLRILEVIGLVFLVSLVGHFFGWAAGSCKDQPTEWEEEGYGIR